jgi:type I restriction enzyme S subunit
MGQRLVQLRANTSILSPAYLLFILLHDLAPERLGRLMAGSTSKHLNVKDLRKLSIPLPPLPLQQKFAAIVESVERQKAAQRAHLAELDALFAALQHRAFRGEL